MIYQSKTDNFHAIRGAGSVGVSDSARNYGMEYGDGVAARKCGRDYVRPRAERRPTMTSHIRGAFYFEEKAGK